MEIYVKSLSLVGIYAERLIYTAIYKCFLKKHPLINTANVTQIIHIFMDIWEGYFLKLFILK